MGDKRFETEWEKVEREEREKEWERIEKQGEITKENYRNIRAILIESKNDTKAAIDIAQKRVDVLLSSICAGGLITIFQIFNKVGIGGINGLGDYEIFYMKISAILFVICLLINFLKSNISVLILSLYSNSISSKIASIDSRLTEVFFTGNIKTPKDYVGKLGVKIIYWSSGIALVCIITGVIFLGKALNHHIQSYL